jgi:hypothetical protein
MRKVADKYIGRRGEPPSLFSRKSAQRKQDLNDDDRKHLKFCLDIIRNGLLKGKAQADAHAALDFLVAVIDRDYALYRAEKLRGGDSFVDAREDNPELYRQLVNKKVIR